MPDWVRAFAPAKVNLTLHVTGQRADGYHLLDSLVAFTSFGDELRLRPARSMSLRVDGPCAAGVPVDASNLVWKAAQWLRLPPVEIELTKNLPAAAGIGGGSSDAAAAVGALCQLFDRPLPDLADTAALGADVPVCLCGQTCRMRGIGDVIEPLPDLPKLHILLVNPGVHVATPDIFKALACKTNAAMGPVVSGADAAGFIDYLAGCRNDLQDPAIATAPEIAGVLGILRGFDLPLVRMSGSGATCFALSSDPSEIAHVAQQIRLQHPDFWVASGALG